MDVDVRVEGEGMTVERLGVGMGEIKLELIGREGE